MISAEGENGILLDSITAFTNLIINGKVPEGIRSFFFGGRLIALNKNSGGIRPIVIGLTLRRLASKVINDYAVRKLVVDLLAPLQLGVGVPRGVEAAIHATRLYTSNLPDDHAIVKLDIKNAFNSIRRDSMLETIKNELPECYAFIHSAYASSSLLLFDNHVISSEEGVQQGDPLGPLLFSLTIQPIIRQCAIIRHPLGPLLFSLTIQPIIRQCKSDLHIAYLD